MNPATNAIMESYNLAAGTILTGDLRDVSASNSAIEMVRGPRRTRRSDATKQLIIDAAGELLARSGYEATTLDAIAALAGITRAAVYYHFDSKESIYAAVLVYSSAEVVERLNNLAETTSSAAAVEAVIDIIAAKSTHPTRRHIYYDEIVRGDPAVQRLTQEALDLAGPAVTRLIARGQAEGTVVPGPPVLLARILRGSVARTARWYDPTGDVGPADFVALLKRLLLPGFLTERGRREIDFDKRFGID